MKRVDEIAGPSLELEQQSAALLRGAGAFQPHSGIISARRLWRIWQREQCWEANEAECLELGQVDLWEEMDWVAAACGLRPKEKTVLSMARLDQYTYGEIARELDISERRVGAILAGALRKTRAHFEDAGSPRALFWEEVRDKSRCIYRRRRVGWIR
jgi:hypothetical protein